MDCTLPGLAAKLLVTLFIVGPEVTCPVPDDAGATISPSDANNSCQQSADWWASRLSSSNRVEQRTAFEELVACGESAFSIFADFFRSNDAELWRHANDGLARIPTSVPFLATLTRDPNPTVRYYAVGILGDLAPESASAVDALAEALLDTDVRVAREAAWALANMRQQAAPAAQRLVRALSHADAEVRLNAAGAMTALCPTDAEAISALILAMRDPNSSVRRCAAEALGAIGPAASAAIPQLQAAIDDENLYVRLSAIIALGRFGPVARIALDSLLLAETKSELSAEATRALSLIRGEDSPPTRISPPATSALTGCAPQTRGDEWPMLCGSPDRNAVSLALNLPVDWDVKTGRNVGWSARLGNQTFGSPVVAGGRVFIGTDNGSPRDSALRDARGVLMAFRAVNGEFLWQDTVAQSNRGLREFLLPATTSTPLIEGNRLYYVTAECQLRCLDTEGFLDGEDDGVRGEPDRSDGSADLIWELDLVARLGVFPHEAANCSVASAGELLMVCTSNGVGESHVDVPAPHAPSFIGVNKVSGDIVWRVVGPGRNVLHGQWSSPAVASVNGRCLAIFGGGDGWLYALDAATGREIWRFDGNPKNAVWRISGAPRETPTRNSIIACPVVEKDVVYLGMGQDPYHGPGPGRLHAIHAGGTGDVTETRHIWEYASVGRIVGTPIVRQDSVYVGDTSGWVHCVDARTGERIWVHDIGAAIWGTMLIAETRLYVGDEAGVMTVLEVGPPPKVVAQLEMGESMWSSPAVSDQSIFIATANRLFRLQKR